MSNALAARIRSAIREVLDFPREGINFYDITTVIQNGQLFHDVVNFFVERYQSMDLDAVVGIEARGFIFGAPVAYELGKPFVPIRKPGKLPSAVERMSYTLEYGEGVLEIHRDALTSGMQTVLIDDLLATGGTARASVDLIHKLGASVREFAVLVELERLNGRIEVEPTEMLSLVKYAD